MQEKGTPVNFTSGVFDKPRQPRLEPRKTSSNSQPTQTTSQPVSQELRPSEAVKEQFPDVFQQQREMTRETIQKMKSAARADGVDQEQVNRINEAMSNQNSVSRDDDSDKITVEDMAMAEQLIFRGYAEMDIEMNAFPGKKITICSTNADEIGLIDDVVFDMIKNAKKNSDGTVDLAEGKVAAMRNAVFVAVCYRGIDGKELSPDPKYYLNTIKKASLKLNELYSEGDLKGAEELKSGLCQSVMKRAMLVKRLPTTMIDFISKQKLNFDSKMSRIMEMKKIVPKS